MIRGTKYYFFICFNNFQIYLFYEYTLECPNCRVMYKRSTTWGDVENRFFSREKSNAMKKSMRKEEIEQAMINEIFTRERLVYDNEKGKKIIVKEKIDFSLNQSTPLREKEFHYRIKANLIEKSAKLQKLGDQRHAEKCTFQPTII